MVVEPGVYRVAESSETPGFSKMEREKEPTPACLLIPTHMYCGGDAPTHQHRHTHTHSNKEVKI